MSKNGLQAKAKADQLIHNIRRLPERTPERYAQSEYSKVTDIVPQLATPPMLAFWLKFIICEVEWLI